MKPLVDSAHLLIVDDDAFSRILSVKTLRRAGFTVSEAVDGEDALAQFALHRHDLIVLDLMMPGLDGFEVCQRIRATLRGAGTPILILTGLNDTESIERAYQHGATDFITKPINWNLLTHRVRYALRASSSVEAIRQSRESLARAQSLAGMGNWAMYPDGRFECSDELQHLLGASAHTGPCDSAMAFLQRVLETDRDRVGAARAQLLEEGVGYQLQFQLQSFDGVVRRMFEQAAPILDDQGARSGVEGITQDITARVEAEERIRQLIHYDVVTGLPNRKLLATLAEAPLERARRNQTGAAVLHVDIDRFRSINDAFGRGYGDTVLRTVAERLRLWIRKSDLASAAHQHNEDDVVARVGGNAFTMLIVDIAGQAQATLVAERLLKVIAEPIAMEPQVLILTASIGIAFFPGDALDLPGLARCAEQAADAAKNAGRGQHRFFDEQMNAHAASRLRLESQLRAGIDNDELCLHFQPKVDAATRAIVGVEALVRWQHPQRGLLHPADFITFAEDTGLILPLTDWVLETACRALCSWAEAGLPCVPLSVNLAAPSLADGHFIDKIDALVAHYGVAPAMLVLEITETMLVRDIEQGVALLQRLHERGYRISLDDFGTGHSSLSYLNRLPIDELKIDRSFVTDAVRCPRSGSLVAAIIALGRELGLQVVAEGVETVAQAAFLLERGCPLQQGFLYTRPVPAAQFEALLQTGAIR